MAPGMNRAVLTSLIAAGVGATGPAPLAPRLAVAGGWSANLPLGDHVDRPERGG